MSFPTKDQIVRAQSLLNKNGFPCGQADGVIGPLTRQAIFAFQHAFLGGFGDFTKLEINGHLNKSTYAAILQLPMLSWHYTSTDFRQKNGGPCYIQRELVFGFEFLTHVARLKGRIPANGKVQVVSGYRSPTYNAAIGGAPNSVHIYGLAGDLPQIFTVGEVKQMGIWSGIGSMGSTSDSAKVAHLDLRHLPPRSNTKYSPSHPSQWAYK